MESLNLKSKNKINKNYYGYIFTLPFIVIFLAFNLYPLLYTFYLSLTDTTLMNSSYHFVGLANFQQLFSDNYFLKSAINTWKIWLMNFIPQLTIAMLLAIWFVNNRLKIKFIGLWRTIYYLPNILMPVAIAALFYNFFSLYGPVNQIAVRTGILEEAYNFFRNPFWTQFIVAFIQWWMWYGVTIIFLMAGLSSISPSYYESALVDGANSWQMFTKITLPLLKPVLIYVLVTSLSGGMQMFDIPYLLTDGTGAPDGAIRTMSVLMYMKFSSGDGYIGAAASVGVMIFLITAVAAFIIINLLKERK